jgi:hypothetical protein
MRDRANRSLPVRCWLPQVLAIILAIGPVCGGEQTPSAQAPNPPVAQPAPTAPIAQLPMMRSLKLTALAGNKAMNDLERVLMSPLVIQVLDQNDRPVEGAEVVFRFPLNGPGATFRGGNTSQTVRTNGQGQAAATNWTANRVGTFDVHVTAAYGNQLGETTVSMTNVTRIVEAEKGRRKQAKWYSSKWVKIALIAGGAAAVAGIVLATRGGGGSSSSTSTVTITPGSPTVGGPH